MKVVPWRVRELVIFEQYIAPPAFDAVQLVNEEEVIVTVLKSSRSTAPPPLALQDLNVQPEIVTEPERVLG